MDSNLFGIESLGPLDYLITEHNIEDIFPELVGVDDAAFTGTSPISLGGRNNPGERKPSALERIGKKPSDPEAPPKPSVFDRIGKVPTQSVFNRLSDATPSKCFESPSTFVGQLKESLKSELQGLTALGIKKKYYEKVRFYFVWKSVIRTGTLKCLMFSILF